MLIGENSRRVVQDVKAEIAEIQKALPKGVTIEPLYDRNLLINNTLDTVMHNLLEGGTLVILVLLLMLGDVRGGLIVALAIPLSMLFAANVMLATGVSASLMSLGAIDFGLIVDSSVIMIENCVRRLAHEGGTRPKQDIVLDAAVEVRKPTMFGELIITIVYLPILALQGSEGKLFRPMALTVIFALAGSLVLSLTFMPVMASLGLSSRPPGEGNLADPQAQAGVRADPRRFPPPSGPGVRRGGRPGTREPSSRLEHGGRVHAAAQRGRSADRGRSDTLRGAGAGGADFDPDREATAELPGGSSSSFARPVGPRSPTT